MDPHFQKKYEEELHFVRHMGEEFAEDFPKIARRLSLRDLECKDPYVERLLEGFAFLAARVKHKLDARFPDFTQQLLELVYPHFLAPVPSMMIAQLQPDMQEPALMQGVTLPRHTSLRSLYSGSLKTQVEYSTAQATTLWPVEVVRSSYLPTTAELGAKGVESLRGARAGLSIRLRTLGDIAFDQTSLDSLQFYLSGTDSVPLQLLESMTGSDTLGFYVRPVGGIEPWWLWRDGALLRQCGFERDEALLPYTRRSFSGYRLLQEYFAFSERFRFVAFDGLGPAVKRCSGTELELILLFSQGNPDLENQVTAEHFQLFCTPAINLFSRKGARVVFDPHKTEQQVIADRTRPMDYEVHSITRVEGFSSGNTSRREFTPLFGSTEPQAAAYVLRREPRRPSPKQRAKGARSHYLGSEVFVALTDPMNAPYATDLRQLSFDLLCTNRDLPQLGMALGKGRTDFTLDSGLPVLAVRALRAPSGPKPPRYYGKQAWDLINHLSLNYLSINDADEDERAHWDEADSPKSDRGAADLMRRALSLYVAKDDKVFQQQIQAIRRVGSREVVSRLRRNGCFTYVRGVEITVECDEQGFAGGSLFLFGSVLKEFLRRYASISSFVDVRLVSQQRGEVMHWPAQPGQQAAL